MTEAWLSRETDIARVTARIADPALRQQAIDALVLREPPPDLNDLVYPFEVAHAEWLQWRETGQFYDWQLPPEFRDTVLRRDVALFDRYWKYTIAVKRHMALEGGVEE
jgi:hypothetical protein